MLMDSEVNRLLFIVVLFLCVGGMFIGVLCYVHAELNGFLRDGTEGEYVGIRLDKRLEIAETGNEWLALKLCMELWWCHSFWRHSSQCVWSRERGARQEVWVNRLMDLRSMVKRPRVL